MKDSGLLNIYKYCCGTLNIAIIVAALSKRGSFHL